MKFELHYSEVLNGSLNPGDLNLVMTFQVNCPGCFRYGFPLMNRLQERYADRLSCIALSTAFEDFDLNTADNTRLLIDRGEFVGETQMAYRAGMVEWRKVLFPILIDRRASRADLLDMEFIEGIIRRRKLQLTPKLEMDKLHEALHNYFGQLPTCGFTFAANLMQGTPSFVLFNKDMEILTEWFGHADIAWIEETLATFIEKKK